MTQRSVLVPLDGSRLAEAVMPLVGRLAKAVDARVMLLHVLEDHSPEEIHGEHHLSEANGAQAYLHDVADTLRAAGVEEIALHVHENREHDVARAIVQHANEFAVDLVVLANHGSGGMREFLFGTIAQKVIRQGTIPVITVPVRHLSDMPPYSGLKSIVMALNGTAEAEAALEPTVWIAQGYDVPVRVAAAVETAATMTGENRVIASMIPSATRAVLQIQEEATREYLKGVVALLEARGVRASSVMLRGDPADAITTEAIQSGAGLLVLATHGRSGLGGLWAGSVGSRVLVKYGKPLLLVHAPDGGENAD